MNENIIKSQYNIPGPIDLKTLIKQQNIILNKMLEVLGEIKDNLQINSLGLVQPTSLAEINQQILETIDIGNSN